MGVPAALSEGAGRKGRDRLHAIRVTIATRRMCCRCFCGCPPRLVAATRGAPGRSASERPSAAETTTAK
jgi:hypothetical protein